MKREGWETRSAEMATVGESVRATGRGPVVRFTEYSRTGERFEVQVDTRTGSRVVLLVDDPRAA